jgi:hypothetical protein
MEKATFNDLLALKMKKDEKKGKVYEIPLKSLGKSITFKEPSDEMRLDMMDEMGTSPSPRDLVVMYKKLIYLTCERLQDPGLHEELGIVDPYDTVDAIFTLNDIVEIGEQLMDSIDSPDEEIKNS